MLSWQVLTYLVLGTFIWTSLISFLLLRTMRHYRKLTKGLNQPNLEQVLTRLINAQDASNKKFAQIDQNIKYLEGSSKRFFHKYALVRFNPFEETGGDQSFVIALLDGANSGIVISSLHSRGGTRVYAKPVIDGKATTHQFSREEKEVVEKAAHQV